MFERSRFKTQVTKITEKIQDQFTPHCTHIHSIRIQPNYCKYEKPAPSNHIKSDTHLSHLVVGRQRLGVHVEQKQTLVLVARRRCAVRFERLDDADDGDDVAGQTRVDEIFGELAVHLCVCVYVCERERESERERE